MRVRREPAYALLRRPHDELQAIPFQVFSNGAATALKAERQLSEVDVVEGLAFILKAVLYERLQGGVLG